MPETFLASTPPSSSLPRAEIKLDVPDLPGEEPPAAAPFTVNITLSNGNEETSFSKPVTLTLCKFGLTELPVAVPPLPVAVPVVAPPVPEPPAAVVAPPPAPPAPGVVVPGFELPAMNTSVHAARPKSAGTIAATRERAE